MRLTGIKLGGVPPFTDPITLRFDERVNVFIGPNASGKSTLLMVLSSDWTEEEEYGMIERSIRLYPPIVTDDGNFDDCLGTHPANCMENSVIGIRGWDFEDPDARKPLRIRLQSVREDLPDFPRKLVPNLYGDTAAKILAGYFSGSRTMRAYELLVRELPSFGPTITERQARSAGYKRYQALRQAMTMANACSKHICDEVIRDAQSHNYIFGNNLQEWLSSPSADPYEFPILRAMGVNTTDIRNFEDFSPDHEPARHFYKQGEELPIYLGHLSSGTGGTLLWIRWLALKMVHHYNFEEGWQNKPAILLIDEIENHLHPTWQRRVIPALLEYFPGLQIFATTHSPFVVAGLKAGQVHVLKRDSDGVVTASSEQRDVIGWTADEILRGMMGVEEPTDQITVDRAKRLRELREKEGLTEKEREELNQLRRQVNEDLLNKGGPLEAQRERYADLMENFLRSRMSD